MRWKTALHAFDITFNGPTLSSPSVTNNPSYTARLTDPLAIPPA